MTERKHASAAANTVARLRKAGLRPTRQRRLLAELLFRRGNGHVTAERLRLEAEQSGCHVSLATIYNTLHQFTAAGLLRQVIVDSARTHFDTNMEPHQHFYDEAQGELIDIPGDAIAVTGLPSAPKGMTVAAVDVVIRLRPAID